MGDVLWVAALTAQKLVSVREGATANVLDTPAVWPIAGFAAGDEESFVTVAESSGKPLMEATADDSVRSAE